MQSEIVDLQMQINSLKEQVELLQKLVYAQGNTISSHHDLLKTIVEKEIKRMEQK